MKLKKIKLKKYNIEKIKNIPENYTVMNYYRSRKNILISEYLKLIGQCVST